MEGANAFVRLQFNEGAGTLEVLLLTSRIGGYYYPGTVPLHLAINGREEVWGLSKPLFDLVCEEHQAAAVVVHRGAQYHLTHALWRSLFDRCCDYVESAELGIPTMVEIVATPLD